MAGSDLWREVAVETQPQWVDLEETQCHFLQAEVMAPAFLPKRGTVDQALFKAARVARHWPSGEKEDREEMPATMKNSDRLETAATLVVALNPSAELAAN